MVVLRPGHAKTRGSRMFVRPRDPERGDLDGPARRASRAPCATSARTRPSPSAELDDKLAEILAGADEIHFPFGREPALDAAVARVLGRLRAAERRGTRAPRAPRRSRA